MKYIVRSVYLTMRLISDVSELKIGGKLSNMDIDSLSKWSCIQMLLFDQIQ